MLTQENIKDFTLEDFFGGFFHLFYSIPIDFFTRHTIEALIDIRFKLLTDSAFFSHLIHTTDIWLNLDFDLQNFYWDYIKEIYSQDPKHYLKCVSIHRLVQIVKHLSITKRGPCCHMHKGQNVKWFMRSSTKTQQITDLALYLQPILRIIKSILYGNYRDREISKSICTLAEAVNYRPTSCFKIEIMKVIHELLTEDEMAASVFRAHLKEEKHFYLVLKVFQDSYYDVQTY